MKRKSKAVQSGPLQGFRNMTPKQAAKAGWKAADNLVRNFPKSEVEFIRIDKAVARCRWCKRNDVPAQEMAVFSWKASFQMFTGVCLKCIKSDKAERKYMLV